MAQAPASASWEPLGETFYRKQDIYSMQWSISDLSDFIVAGAPWGGPLGALLVVDYNEAERARADAASLVALLQQP